VADFIRKNFLLEFFHLNLCLSLGMALGACAPSGSPQVTEIVVTNPPTFGGLLKRSFTTTSFDYTLVGECDPISRGLEYSFDESTWISIPASCPSGGFSLPLRITRLKHVYVRALTKTGTTADAVATIRYLLPPTSPMFTLVSSSRMDDEGSAGMQSSAGITVGPAMDNGIVKLFPRPLGIEYGQ
jgi:hypothetical protein